MLAQQTTTLQGFQVIVASQTSLAMPASNQNMPQPVRPVLLHTMPCLCSIVGLPEIGRNAHQEAETTKSDRIVVTRGGRDGLHHTETPQSPYCSGMTSSKDMAVELGIHAAGIVGDKGKLGINRPGSGEGDAAQGVGHQEGLQETILRMDPADSEQQQQIIKTYRFVLVVYFDSFG